MRFSVAWAAVAAQNVTLKAAVACLSLVSIALSVSTARLSFRKPLLIERSCFTRTVDLAPDTHTTAEIETFVRESLRQRFDSEAKPLPDYLAPEEIAARGQEQKELTQRNMVQFVIVRAVKVDGSQATVEADRLISVEQIRTAFPFTLKLQLASTTRTESNPYGLELVKVELLKPESKR